MVVAQDERGLIIVSWILKEAPFPPITSREKRLPAMCSLQPDRPSNGCGGPSMPSRASSAANTPALPAWPAVTAFHMDRWPVRTRLRMLFGTAAMARA